MNSYEIEGKLRDKADKWELHNVQNENRELRNNIHELGIKIGNVELIVAENPENRGFSLKI